jgi:hypothetical protein
MPGLFLFAFKNMFSRQGAKHAKLFIVFRSGFSREQREKRKTILNAVASS